MKTSRFFPHLVLAAILSQLKPGDMPKVKSFRGMAISGYNPMFIPRRRKFKGYMRENRKCSFNKNR